MSLCPSCGSDTKVLDTRMNEQGYRWRRRQCKACNERFATYELPESALVMQQDDDLDRIDE